MKCINPVLCYTNGKGNRKFIHWDLANAVIKARQHVVFNCGQCLICRKKRAYDLAMRCVLHASMYVHNSFLTLTYDEKNPGYHNNFDYSDIQKFKKRFRQHVWREHKQRMEIFNVHEYGKKGKKHWHLVVLNYSPHQEPDQKGKPDCRIHTRSNGIGLYVSETLSRLWPHGFSTFGDISEASAMYAAQYVEKDFKNGNRQNSKKSHSKHSGLGKAFFNRYYQQLLRLGYVPFKGNKVPLPRYFEKLAHKHFCHYYEKSAFFDTVDRKALYRPFKKEDPNKEIADLYVNYKRQKELKVQELEAQWHDILVTHFETKQEPDFVKSGKNQAYDLKNKKTGETL